MTRTLFRNEIRMLLRDSRTVLIAVVAPLILFPAVILIANWVEGQEEDRLESETYEYALMGERSAWAEQVIMAALALEADASRPGSAAVEALNPTTEGDGPGILPADFRWVEAPDPEAFLESGGLHLLVVARDAEVEDSLPAGTPVLELRYRARSDFSRNARDRLAERLVHIRTEMRDSVFRSVGFPVEVGEVAAVDVENVASSEKEAGGLLGGILVPILILLMLSGGSIVASDSISGEKERGTLETLLTTAASRRDIIQAKLWAIMAVGLAVTVVNIANVVVYARFGILDIPDILNVSLSVHAVGALFLLLLPLVVLVAAALLLLSGIAKSYKEYQIYFLPLSLVFLVAGVAALIPGMEQESVVSLVPISGIAVSVRALMTEDWHLSWGMLAFASTGGAGWLLLRQAEAALSNERLISSGGADEADFRGGAALFPRHVVSWFLGFWVVFFLVSLWFGEALGVRWSVVVNLVGIFLGGSVLLMRRYRLDVRETLQLYAPDWRAWPAVILGAPSFLILVAGLSTLVNRYVFPVPDSMMEAFAEDLTQGIPGWQLVLFITVMPGILEEIAFRGVLFSGLRKQLGKPWLAILASGVIFGLFHVSLFRLVPTAVLGVVLAAVVWKTGSILPAMLWHFLNNLLAVAAQSGWLPLENLETVPLSWYLGAGGGAVASWLLLRARPGQSPPEP